MPDMITITINGREVSVRPGTWVAAALFTAGVPTRRSVTGQPRAALCGMGICFECRATVDGVAQRRTCMMPCQDGMTVTTE